MCITEGLVNQVMCCDTTCAKFLKKPPDPKTSQDHSIMPCTSSPSHNVNSCVVLNPLCLVPSTLARIFPDQPPLVTRYIRLIKQKYYETIGETIYCPLDHCRNPNIPSDTESKVVVCTKCRYAFCKLCRCSWHGAGTSCKIQNGYIFTCPSCACRVTFMLLFMFALCAHTDRIVSWRSSWKRVKRKRNECKSCTASKF